MRVIFINNRVLSNAGLEISICESKLQIGFKFLQWMNKNGDIKGVCFAK